jgi:putative protease
LDRKKDWTWVKEGFKVFRNHSPKILKEINSTISPTDTKNKKLFSIDISFTSIGNVNVKIHYAQKTTNCISEIRITESEKKLDTNYFKKEISRLSRTDYVLDRFKCENLLGFIPGKSIRKLKTEILNQLKLIDTAISPPAIVCENPYQNLASLDKQKSTKSKLIVLVRREWQIDALETLNVDTIYMDFEFGRQYKTGLAKIRSFGKKAGIATLRVHKEGDDVHLKMIQRLAPDVVLVRNPGALHFFQNSNLTLVGDYSLNITNSMSFEYFQSKNLERILPSYDLNAEQLEDLLNVVDGKNIEVNIHHYMPAFHMEHCVFAKYLSDGNSWKDCGKPCEKHKVEVVDHKGESHFLATDHECRNTMFRGKPQSSLKLKSLYLNNSIEYFRIECLHESAEDVFAKVKTYSDWIEGHLTEKDVMEQIDAEEKYGVAAGQLFNFQNFVDRKKTTN